MIQYAGAVVVDRWRPGLQDRPIKPYDMHTSRMEKIRPISQRHSGMRIQSVITD